MKQGVYKDTIARALQNTGSTDADIVYEELHRLAGLRGHTRDSFERFLPEVIEAMQRAAGGKDRSSGAKNSGYPLVLPD